MQDLFHMQIGGYSNAPLRLTEQIQKVVWRGLVTEEMLQANPKDLRKSPGGRAGLKIIYLSVCCRDDTHCVGKKASGSLMSPFF